MRKTLFFILALAMVLCACAGTSGDAPTAPSIQTYPSSPLETIVTETSLPETTADPHSALYLPQYTAEDVIMYFNEVCLQAEYWDSGDPSLLQKWVAPITYCVLGQPTEQDLAAINNLVQQLNSIDGFPGMQEVQQEREASLPIYFCTQQELADRMGSSTGYDELDGAVTFWYNGEQEITNAIICVRTDLPQELRDSVILEEIYNGLGPIQDTVLREDSIIYQYGSDVLTLSEMDILILQVLYHPQILCGMTAEECETVIQDIYY